MSARLGLDHDSAERLARLLGMLGSDHDGEVVNAGRMADRLVRQNGLTWPDIIAPKHPALFVPLSREPATALEWRQLAAWIKRNFADQLNPREYQFVTHMVTWRTEPSPKQTKWLREIAERFAEATA
jgi:hypothetical protein